MLPDKRPRLIFFLYLITIAQDKSNIYKKNRLYVFKTEWVSLPCLHKPAILNLRPRFCARSQKLSGLD